MQELDDRNVLECVKETDAVQNGQHPFLASEGTHHRSAGVGTLHIISHEVPDINHAVKNVSRQLASPTEAEM